MESIVIFLSFLGCSTITYLLLYTDATARFAKEHNIPFLYRKQFPPEFPELISMSTLADTFKSIRMMSRAEISCIPEHHYGLGLTGYCRVTSPARRYLDIISHRQVGNILLLASYDH